MSQSEKLPKPAIPSKPVMSDEAASYPRLLKIYKELNRQNGIIFDAERERNALEPPRDSLKGFAKRYGFRTTHDFYKAYASAKNAYADYQDKLAKWEETYGENALKPKKESVYERLQNYQKENVNRQVFGFRT